MSPEETREPAVSEPATFRVLGLLGLGLTLFALRPLLEPASFPIHAVWVTSASALVTWRMGRWADGWVQERSPAHALWLGPVCAVAVLGAITFALLLSNGPATLDKPGAHLFWVMLVALSGLPVALLAGFLCGLLVFGMLSLRARGR